jgi:hypothetical protein
VTLNVTRQTDAYSVPVLFWPLILPTIACFFVLAGTLLLSNKKEDTGNKLTIFLAIFIFAPTFFLGIQSFLPMRSALSIPEVLIENLIISAAVFSIFSCIRTENCWLSFVKDGVMIFLSFVLNSLIFSSPLPSFPTNAQFVIIITVLFYSGFAVSIWSAKIINALVNREFSRLSIEDRIFLSKWGKLKVTLPFVVAYGFSLLIMSYGFLLWTWTFGPYNIVSVLGIGFGIAGVILLSYFLFLSDWSKHHKTKPKSPHSPVEKPTPDCM